MRARFLALGLLLLAWVPRCSARTGLGVPATTERDAGGSREDAAAAPGLPSLRFENPCWETTDDPRFCTTIGGGYGTTVPLTGEPGKTYEITLRIRGVVELAPYDGGTNDGLFQIGGAPPTDSTWTVFGLGNNPWSPDHYLNRGTPSPAVVAVDYTETLSMTTGDTLSLTSDTRDFVQLRNLDPNGQPIVVPGVEPAPAAFDGQFMQVDVVSIK